MTQSTDFDLQQFLPYLLNQAAEASSLSFQQVYKDRYGMLRTEWRVLFHLGIYGQMTAGDIGRKASMHKTKISRAVQRLEERRYLLRERDTQDRRLDHLSLPKAGRAVYQDLCAYAEQYETQLVASLDQAELSTLRRALLKLSGAG